MTAEIVFSNEFPLRTVSIFYLRCSFALCMHPVTQWASLFEMSRKVFYTCWKWHRLCESRAIFLHDILIERVLPSSNVVALVSGDRGPTPMALYASITIPYFANRFKSVRRYSKRWSNDGVVIIGVLKL